MNLPDKPCTPEHWGIVMVCQWGDARRAECLWGQRNIWSHWTALGGSNVVECCRHLALQWVSVGLTRGVGDLRSEASHNGMALKGVFCFPSWSQVCAIAVLSLTDEAMHVGEVLYPDFKMYRFGCVLWKCVSPESVPWIMSMEPDDFFWKKVSEVASHKAFEHTLKVKDK